MFLARPISRRIGATYGSDCNHGPYEIQSLSGTMKAQGPQQARFGSMGQPIPDQGQNRGKAPHALNDRNYLRQLKRFAFVGLLNTVVDLAVLNILIFATGRGHNGGFYFTVFKMISFVAAAANSYVLNARWTFELKHERNPLEVVRFMASSGVGFIINVTVASYVASVWCAHCGAPALLAFDRRYYWNRRWPCLELRRLQMDRIHPYWTEASLALSRT